MKIYIYVLLDEHEIVRYVGRTVDPVKRFKQHCQHRQWVASLKVIDWCSESDWQEREIYWIGEYRSRGYPLENMTIGGEGLLNPSTEVRRRISQTLKMKGMKLPDWHRKKLSEANRDKIVTPETRRLLSEQKRGQKNPFFGTVPWNLGSGKSGMSGKKHSAETREKMSRIAKDRNHYRNFQKAAIDA